MKKIIFLALAILAICITVSAVSADDSWSFSFGSEANTDGGSISIINDELKIQDEKFTIPDGFKEDKKERVVGEESKAVDGGKVTGAVFNKGNESFLVEIHFADGGIENITYPENSTNVTIGKQAGVLSEDEDGHYVFDFETNEKLVQIVATNQDIIEEVLK